MKIDAYFGLMQKTKPYGETLKEQLRAGSKDRLYNFLLADGAVRGVIMNGTRMVNEMRANHDLGILETLVSGSARFTPSSRLRHNMSLCCSIGGLGLIPGT